MDSDLDIYPRGIFHTAALTSTPQRVGGVDEAVRVKWVHLRGGAAEEIVDFQSEDGTQLYFSIELSINETVKLGAFQVPETTSGQAGGLEVVTQSAATGLLCTIAYKTTVFA